MQTFIIPADLAPFAEIAEAKAQAMIDDCLAMAVKIAPCLKDDSFSDVAAVRAILRRAVLRWDATGATGARTQLSMGAGSFNQAETTEVRTSRGLFWPSEIKDLQDLCKTQNEGAFAIDTAPGTSYTAHLDWCNLPLSYGTLPCSCGASIAGHPIYELGADA